MEVLYSPLVPRLLACSVSFSKEGLQGDEAHMLKSQDINFMQLLSMQLHEMFPPDFLCFARVKVFYSICQSFPSGRGCDLP